jgi:CRP/FNR family cyclic AMP-dependent transcriptional regulator
MIDINTLQKYSLFGGVTCEQIEKIKPLLGTKHFEAGECPQIEGQPNDKIYFILSGEVEVIKQGVVIARLREGETFGEMELLDIMPSIATIRAATPLEVVMISNRALYDISKLDLKTFSMVVMNLARDLSRRLRRMDELACGEVKVT